MSYEPRSLDARDVRFQGATLLRDHVLHLVREERARQLQLYGTNSELGLGFGGNVSTYPWLTPFTDDAAREIQADFRTDYEKYEADNGAPTWMHLIREEVAELFDTHTVEDAVAEAIQVAALCVSLVEHLFTAHEGDCK